MKKTLLILAALLLLATASAAQAKRPRPNDVQGVQTTITPNDLQLYNEYASPETTYASVRVVVHYVVLGLDAPPLNDDDRTGVPDYVERVGEAADRALAYYERRGFRMPLQDAGGPDARPDLYISRFAPGTLGVAFPAVNADGGAFVVVSNNLDPSAERSFASVYATVAHELFHLVQFSYFARGAEPVLPTWILEGTAAGMEGRVYPELDDLVSSLQLRRWFTATQVPLTEQTYGAQLLWRYLDVREPGLLPALLQRLGSRPRQSDGLHTVGSIFRQVAGADLAPVFARFAFSVAAGHAAEIRPLFDLPRGTTRRAVVAPLAVHFLKPVLPGAGGYSLTVRFPKGRGSATAALTYELENETPGGPASFERVAGRWSDHGRSATFVVPRVLRADPRLLVPRLVIANGGERPVPYVVGARSARWSAAR
jgi:hypothetical protein